MFRQTSDSFQKANEYFGQSIKIAPDYAEGYVGLAAVYVLAGDVVISNQQAMPKAKELLATALRLDDTNADAHTWLGWIHWNYEYDWVAAETEYRRAIELAPGNSDAHASYAYMLTLQARFDEAERELKLAQLIDPLFPSNYVTRGLLLAFRGDYPKALEQFHNALEIDPKSWLAYIYLGYCYDLMGNHGEALKASEEGVAIEPAPLPISYLAAEYARSGNREQARKTLEQLNHLPAQTYYVAPCYPARAYAALGQNSTAMDLLEKAYQERSACVAGIKVFHVWWDPLRSDPRFIELMKKVGLGN
jgi:serine/threonine-protein kinase